MVICKRCGFEMKHCAFNMCQSRYNKEHRIKRKKYFKDRIKRLKELSLCIGCGKEKIFYNKSKNYCFKCHKKKLKFSKKYYNDKIKSKLCRSCSNFIEVGISNTYCIKCLKKHRESSNNYYNKNKVSRSNYLNGRKNKLKEKGICVLCATNKIEIGYNNYCKDCRLRSNLLERIRNSDNKIYSGFTGTLDYGIKIRKELGCL